MRSSFLALALTLTLAVAALAAGCNPRPGFWHGCTLASSPDEAAFAYADDSGVVLMRQGARHVVGYAAGSCLEHGRDIDLVAVLADGWRVIVLGERTDSSFMDQHPQFDTSVACIVDFRTSLAAPLGAQVPAELGLTDEIRHRAVRVGGRTGRIYTWTGFGPPAIFDPTTGKVATLDGVDVALSDGCEVAENEREAVMACTGFRARAAGGGEGGFVQLIRMDLAAWPPVPVVQELAAPSPPARVALAPGATRVAFWSNELGGGGGFLHVVALASPADVLALPHGPGSVYAVAFAGEDLLVGSVVAERSRESGIIRTFRGGATPPTRIAVPERVAKLHPSGGRLLVDEGCRARWIDLPR